MTVFFIAVIENQEGVEAKIKQNFVDNWLKVDDDKFLVADDGFSREVAEKIGMRGDAPNATGIVFPITTYSGRASTDVWEWLSVKQK